LLFKREKRNGSTTFTLQDQEIAKALGIELEGISPDKAKEATYFTCMRILTDNISKLPLKMKQKSSNGVKERTDHYMHEKLLLRPNMYMSASDFWKAVEFNRNHFGHSIVYINMLPNGQIEGLYPLDMTRVQIWMDDAGIMGNKGAVWYTYTDGSGQRILQIHDVLHFKGLTRNGITGMSVRDYLQSTVENLQYGTEYVNKFFKGGLSAKGLLQYTGDIEPNAMNRMRERFETMANGINNVGKILPVPLGFTFQTINSTMADAQFLELSSFSIRQITAAFGVKMHQVNDLTRATHSNVAETMKEFYIETLQSILVMYEQELSWKLTTEDERKTGNYYQFNVDSILRASLKERYESYKLGIDSGWMYPNDARIQEGLPTDPHGNFLIVNGSMQKLEDVGALYKNPVTPSAADPKDPEDPSKGDPTDPVKGGEEDDGEEE
jgi:HK97 family phage portal protein